MSLSTPQPPDGPSEIVCLESQQEAVKGLSAPPLRQALGGNPQGPAR